jgi:4-hydroxy-tetrahydrodipicolinate synthase
MNGLEPAFLRGSYPPLITPFRDGAVDYETYGALVEFQIARGSHGVVVTGTTGEPSTLTVTERVRLVEVAVQVAAGRIPVVAASGSQSLDETLALTEAAGAAGADAVLVVTPYYIRPPQRGLVQYYLAVGRRTSLPILLYHIPVRAGVSVTVASLEEIADALPNFVGIKHSAYDLVFLTDVVNRFGPEFRVLVGVEELTYPMLLLGACGMVNAAANVAPERLVALYDAVQDECLDVGHRLHQELFELNRAVFWDTNPIPVKYMMKRLGIIRANEHRLPMVPADPVLEARLDRVLKNAQLL